MQPEKGTLRVYQQDNKATKQSTTMTPITIRTNIMMMTMMSRIGKDIKTSFKSQSNQIQFEYPFLFFRPPNDTDDNNKKPIVAVAEQPKQQQQSKENEAHAVSDEGMQNWWE